MTGGGEIAEVVIGVGLGPRLGRHPCDATCTVEVEPAAAAEPIGEPRQVTVRVVGVRAGLAHVRGTGSAVVGSPRPDDLLDEPVARVPGLRQGGGGAQTACGFPAGGVVCEGQLAARGNERWAGPWNRRPTAKSRRRAWYAAPVAPAGRTRS